MNQRDISEAFTRHRFAETYSYFADDIVWYLVGGTNAVGADNVKRICNESAEYLAHQHVEFVRFDITESDDCVVVESEANYIDEKDVASRVASCDIYRFTGTKLVSIRSYNIEIS